MKSTKGQKRDLRRALTNDHGCAWGQIKDLDLAQLRDLRFELMVGVDAFARWAMKA